MNLCKFHLVNYYIFLTCNTTNLIHLNTYKISQATMNYSQNYHKQTILYTNIEIAVL